MTGNKRKRSQEYGNQRSYLTGVSKSKKQRAEKIAKELKEAFSDCIKIEKSEYIYFTDLSAERLAEALFNHPAILKSVLSICNVAARAVERDLNLKNLNTYNPKLDKTSSSILAGYLKPFLPEKAAIVSLVDIDSVFYVDKEIRKTKGAWEKKIVTALNRFGKKSFRKRKFSREGVNYELDAASPEKGDIEIGIDIKRPLQNYDFSFGMC